MRQSTSRESTRGTRSSSVRWKLSARRMRYSALGRYGTSTLQGPSSRSGARNRASEGFPALRSSAKRSSQARSSATRVNARSWPSEKRPSPEQGRPRSSWARRRCAPATTCLGLRHRRERSGRSLAGSYTRISSSGGAGLASAASRASSRSSQGASLMGAGRRVQASREHRRPPSSVMRA